MLKFNNLLSQKIKGISFILIVMVIYIHSYNINSTTVEPLTNADNINIFLQNFFSQGMFRSAVPMFFILSGILFFKNYQGIKDYTNKLLSRLKTLLIPFIFWNIVVILIYYVAQIFILKYISFTSIPIKDLGLDDLIISIFINPYNYPLWFLRDLMIAVLVSPMIYYFIKKHPIIFLLITGILWILNIGAGAKFFIYKSEVIFFFSLGAYIAIQGHSLLSSKINKKLLCITLVFYIVLLFTKTYFLHMNFEIVSITLFMQKIIILIGVFLFWYISSYQWLVKVKVVEFTFLFYVFHEPLLMFSKKICFYLFGINAFYSILFYMLLPIFVIISLYILSINLKKYFPKFTNLVSGGRI